MSRIFTDDEYEIAKELVLNTGEISIRYLRAELGYGQRKCTAIRDKLERDKIIKQVGRSYTVRDTATTEQLAVVTGKLTRLEDLCRRIIGHYDTKGEYYPAHILQMRRLLDDEK